MREDRDKILSADVIVKHFKREVKNDLTDFLLFRVIGVAMDSKNGKEMVVLQSLKGFQSMYVEELNSFLEEVDKEVYPNCKQKYKYELV